MENKITGLNFECHVTVTDNESSRDTWHRIAGVNGWKTSFIVGDPVMPNQSGYFYFTTHGSDYSELGQRMHSLCLCISIAPFVVRKKIELVLYDER